MLSKESSGGYMGVGEEQKPCMGIRTWGCLMRLNFTRCKATNTLKDEYCTSLHPL